jgi:hypothetical protein
LAARVASGLVNLPFLVCASALTPLHVHEPAAGRSHAVVHSHFESHHIAAHESEGPEFEQETERVVWLENAILHQPSYHGDPAPSTPAATFDAMVVVPSWTAMPFDEGAPVHGPPRRHPSLRGPPPDLA